MSPELRDPLLLGSMLAVALLSRRWARGRLVVTVAALIGAIGLSLAWGRIDVDGLSDPSAWSPLCNWLLPWLVAAALLRGRLGVVLLGRFPLGLLAVVGALVFGDVGATLLLLPRADSPRTAARIALTASAAALWSPVGTPAALLVFSPADVGWLPVLLVAVAWPSGAGLSLPVRLTGRRVPSPGYLGWLALVGLLTVVALRSGALVELREGVDWMLSSFGAMGRVAVAGGGVVLSALTGEAGASLALGAAFSSHPGGMAQAELLAGLGLAVGGLTPLLLSGAFREGLRLWLLQVSLFLAWTVFAVGAA